MALEQSMLHVTNEELLFQKTRGRLWDIGNLRFWGTKAIEGITMRYTTAYEKYDDALKAGGWKDIKVGDEWGGDGEFAWFKVPITVPKEFAGKKLVARLKVGTAGWNGGEGCIFIDGVPYQGIDPNHTEVVLAGKAKAGQQYDLIAECVSTEIWQNKRSRVTFEQAEIAVIIPEVWDYFYDLQFIHNIAETLPKGSRRRSTIIRTCNKSIDVFNVELTDFDALAASAKKAAKIIAPLYKCQADASEMEVACNGHSHIDVAWLWPYAETIRKCSRTFSTVDRLMEEYPHYTFTQSQAQLFEFTKENYPALYEKIVKRVKEGRFEPQGSMWVEADCNVSSGESLVRQILLGKGYFLDEFGIENDVFWLPDVFGYSAALPQILKKGGVDFFSTIKIGWNQYNKFPYSSFWWEGIDGTRVLAHFPPSGDYNGRVDPGILRRAADDNREKDRTDITLQSYGHGDGGGGPDRTHLEHLKRAGNLEGIPKSTPMLVTDFFHQLVKRSEDLPSWVGELYLEYHRGTYTTQSRNKRSNRKAEFLLRDAEMAAGLAWVLTGAAYPHAEITKVWKMTCKNQFHDVIPGTSVTEVYVDTAKDYKIINEVGEKVRTGGLEVIGGKEGKGSNLVVFNNLSWDRSDAFKVEVPGKATDWHVETADGKVLPSQAADNSALWVQPESVSGIGVTSMKLVKGASNAKSGIKVSTSGLENDFYKIKLDKNGVIISIFDKVAGREVLPKGEKANVLQLFEDRPIAWDAWDIDFFYRDKVEEINDVSDIKVEEEGPVRGSLYIKRKFGNSVLEQRIVLWANSPRIDFENHTDWHESKKMLKVAFPVDVHANSARFEIQFGSVDRPNHWNTSWDFARFEVAAQKWVDMSQADYGVSLMNDCKYGHDVHENVMRMTLLRSPSSPDPTADKGEHYFTYSIMPHKGGWRDAETVRRAYELNVPMVAWVGDADPAFTGNLISVDAPNVIIDTVKKAEKEDALIVRMYECSGIDAKVNLSTAFSIGSAAEADLLERDTASMKASGNGMSFTMKPFELKTIKLIPAK